MKHLTLAALIAASAAGAAFAPLDALAHDRVSVVIAAPPAPLVERVPAPRHGYLWTRGHWAWNGRRHVWAPGVWIAERPGYVYSAPSWYRGARGWAMAPARWTPHGRDRDHDGVPDRFEGRRDGRYVDHVDHGGRRGDRDGDGVPDRYDSRPDNPNRR